MSAGVVIGNKKLNFQVHGCLATAESEIQSLECIIKSTEKVDIVCIFNDSKSAIDLVQRAYTNKLGNSPVRQVIRRLLKSAKGREWHFNIPHSLPNTGRHIYLNHINSHLKENKEKSKKHRPNLYKKYGDLLDLIINDNDIADKLAAKAYKKG